MGAEDGANILYSESVEPENRESNMEKIWELILILALVGMMFILQLDHKNNMEKSQEKQDEETGKQKDEKDKTDIAESKKVS